MLIVCLDFFPLILYCSVHLTNASYTGQLLSKRIVSERLE